MNILLKPEMEIDEGDGSLSGHVQNLFWGDALMSSTCNEWLTYLHLVIIDPIINNPNVTINFYWHAESLRRNEIWMKLF